MKKDKSIQAVEHILFHCGCLKINEKITILFDEKTREVANKFVSYASCHRLNFKIINVPYRSTHGMEPPESVARYMMESDLIVGMTYASMAHTGARKMACENGARYLSLPQYSVDLLQNPSILVDYFKRGPVVRAVSDRFTAGEVVDIKSENGTDIRLQIKGRKGNCCPGFVSKAGELGSPPDIEANIPPLEDRSQGVIVVDGAIPCPEIGLLKESVKLSVENGKVIGIESDNMIYKSILTKMFSAVGSPNAYIIAELGVGLNEMCTLTGHMLTDEGANGTVHFGLGSNSTIGGASVVNFHLDFVIRAPPVAIDNVVIIDNGNLML